MRKAMKTHPEQSDYGRRPAILDDLLYVAICLCLHLPMYETRGQRRMVMQLKMIARNCMEYQQWFWMKQDEAKYQLLQTLAISMFSLLPRQRQNFPPTTVSFGAEHLCDYGDYIHRTHKDCHPDELLYMCGRMVYVGDDSPMKKKDMYKQKYRSTLLTFVYRYYLNQGLRFDGDEIEEDEKELRGDLIIDLDACKEETVLTKNYISEYSDEELMWADYDW